MPFLVDGILLCRLLILSMTNGPFLSFSISVVSARASKVLTHVWASDAIDLLEMLRRARQAFCVRRRHLLFSSMSAPAAMFKPWRTAAMPPEVGYSSSSSSIFSRSLACIATK